MNTIEVVCRFNNGDERAFKELFDEFLSPLVYFATRLSANREEAEDIVLNTFNKLWTMRDRFQTYENIRAFLYITVRNNCLNYIKAQQRKDKAHKALSYVVNEESSIAPVEEHVHIKMINAHLLSRFQEEVNALPEQCKKVVELSYFKGYTNAQIATTLNTSINTVEVQKNRGLNKLRVSVKAKNILKPIFIWAISMLAFH